MYQLVVLMWLLFFFKTKRRNWKEQTRKRPQQQTNHDSYNIIRWGEEGGRCQYWWGWWREGRRGQNNKDKHGCQFHRLFINTWNVVQSNWVLSVGTVLSFLSLQWCIKTQKSPVCFCWFLRTPERPGLAGWRGVKFLHFTEAYIIFLLPVKQNVFSTGSLVLVMVKKTKKTKTRVRNKKSSGPEHDNADSATSPPSCWSAGFKAKWTIGTTAEWKLVESRARGRIFQNNGIREMFWWGFLLERDDC